MSTPKFIQSNPLFHKELKKRINDYFQQKNILKTGNAKLFTKAILLVVGFVSVYTHLVFFTPSTFWAIFECVILGGLTAAIGFNIMHDGAHGSFSQSKNLNRVAAFTLNLLGGSHFMWNVKHNIIHHSYTNIDGIDDDIDAKPFLRLASTQKRYKMHQFQHYYFWIFYCLLYAYWIYLSDYLKYFSKKIGEFPLQKMKVSDHIGFWSYKILSIFLFIVLPIYMLGVKAWLIGFLIFLLLAGFILSMVFQLAHTVEHTQFPVPDESTGNIEDEWAIHQLKTTANFATKSKTISWLVGGLNFQIEHHLFPRISHIHYPEISKIIKQVCLEYGIVYNEYPKLRYAVASHVSYLKEMGRA